MVRKCGSNPLAPTSPSSNPIWNSPVQQVRSRTGSVYSNIVPKKYEISSTVHVHGSTPSPVGLRRVCVYLFCELCWIEVPFSKLELVFSKPASLHWQLIIVQEQVLWTYNYHHCTRGLFNDSLSNNLRNKWDSELNLPFKTFYITNKNKYIIKSVLNKLRICVIALWKYVRMCSTCNLYDIYLKFQLNVIVNNW